MAKTLAQLIGYSALTGVIQSPKGGIPADILPPQFTTVTERVLGNQAKYFRVEGNRQTARIAQYGSPSQRREMKGISEVPVVLAHSHEHQFHQVSILNQLKSPDPTVQSLGEQNIANQIRNFNDGFNNLRLAMIYSTLCSGKIYADSSGNLLPSSSGAQLTVDFSVPSGNLNQLDVFGGGAIIGASWATAGTDIAGDVKAVKKAALKKTGYPIKHCFYGENILGYLAGNTALKNIITGNPAFSAAFGQNEIPNGFLGLNWHPIDQAFFEDNANAFQDFAAGDAAIFTPDPDPSWWGVIEGSYEVPTNIGTLTSDAMTAAQIFQTVYGKFSYGKVSEDPAGIKHVAGDTVLPVLKVPGAIFIADVTP